MNDIDSHGRGVMDFQRALAALSLSLDVSRLREIDGEAPRLSVFGALRCPSVPGLIAP